MKTMCKRTLAFLLCALLLCGAVPFAASAADVLSGNCGKDGDNVTWMLDKNTGIMTISGTGEMREAWLDVSMNLFPWLSVRNLIRSLIVEDGVENISSNAFYDCDRLSDITIGNSVTSIGNQAFLGCFGLTNVTLSDNITSIGDAAFANCDSLTNLTIPGSVTSIGKSAFDDCDNLKNVTIPGSVSNIGSYAFRRCGQLYEVTIKNGVTSIGWYAFKDCLCLANMTIPNSVTSIGGSAFQSCEALTNVVIPESVEFIGGGAFSYCSRLAAITVDPGNTHYCSDESGVLFNKAKTELIQYPAGNTQTEFVIPQNVQSIVDKAFSGCTDLSAVTIPRETKFIGSSSFADCPGLTSIEVDPNNGYYCSESGVLYYNWSKKTLIRYPAGNTRRSFSIPNGVTEIAYKAFYNCNHLSDVTIPDGLEKINESAFSGCSGLVNISIPNSVTDIARSAFSGCAALESIAISNQVTTISYEAFLDCVKLTDVTIPEGVVIIELRAFGGCASITNVTIPDSVTTIDNFAFSGCVNLSSVTIPDGVSGIGGSAFSDCTSLTHITIPSSVTEIGVDAFKGCLSLTAITVDPRNTVYSSDESGVLYSKDKTRLIQYPAGNARTEFTVPDSVTEIESYGFYACSNLTSFSVGPNNSAYCCDENGVIYSKDKRMMIQYPAGNTRSSFSIPYFVKTFSNYLFSGCLHLKSIVNEVGASFGSSHIFYGCTSLVYVHFSADNIDVGFCAFDHCPNLKYICCDTADCYAKTYAELNGIEFLVCNGEHLQNLPPVQASYDGGTFDVPVSLLAEPQDKAANEWQKYEFDLSLRIGEEKMQSVYLIRMVDDKGNVVQPNAGHKVTLQIPIPFGCSYEICRIAHLLDENGTSESFKWNPTPGSRAKPFTVSEDGRYFIIEVASFSPFIVFAPPSVNIRDTKESLPYGEKRTLTADVENLPDGARIVWTADNANVKLSPSADGRSCEVSAEKNGKVTVTVMVVDKDGKEIKQDGEIVSVSVNLNAKANFFHKLWYWIFRIPWPFGK